MNTSSSIALIALGIIVGSAAALVAPRFWVGTAHAATGTWACGVADRFPDVNSARAWKPAKDLEQGLNKMAPNATAGQTLAVNVKTANIYPHVVCVKN